MNARPDPGLKADDIGKELTTVRAAARAEKRLHGHVLPQTAKRLNDALALAQAYLLVDDAREST
jgi:hypothetical protein